jgi:hypothetical protein
MKKAIFWAIFYTVIAIALFICIIYWPLTSVEYKTSQFLIVVAVVDSGFAIYWINKAVKHIFS